MVLRYVERFFMYLLVISISSFLLKLVFLFLTFFTFIYLHVWVHVGQDARMEVMGQLVGNGPLPSSGPQEGTKLRLGHKCLYSLYYVVVHVFLLIAVNSGLICIFNWVICFPVFKLSPVIRCMFFCLHLAYCFLTVPMTFSLL